MAQQEQEPTPVLEYLEEDDEFEDFAEPDWNATAEDPEDANEWMEDWDDEDIDDDFCTQLRQELDANKMQS
ncbi:unnamed protein product [Heterosigma akashiwo]|eukprot:CAMPEP_0194561862 /NCGR_PEP_ID=MMETSP0292-20121207/2492_1 /TAXON_ID=39354 /ORGANISM="Heterosigma akashiwo, Strain CCMP2393" /LENGTH=70 /DNA_ID=CAMNT_0039410365 /DNA_START=651 /DNA_END=863 /DNA_ORIENTATION=-